MKRLPILAMAATIVPLVFLAPGGARVHAQNRLISLVAQDKGHVALGLAVRKLGVSGTFLQTAAHPDDEHNQIYAMLTHGQGLRSIDVQTTRGAGGQNEIGPELFQDIAVLRTSELMSAHRLDGAEQRFMRTIDYGYSFSPPEVLAKWNQREAVSDVARFIRTFRPDVVLTMNIQGRGGDRAHEATAIVVREGFRAAADPAQFPEQIKEGLRPWQAKKLYFTAGGGVIGAPPPGGGRGAGAAPAAPPAPPAQPAGKFATIDATVFDPLLGRTYNEIGTDARSNHKCQGMGGLPALPGGAGGGRGFGPSRYALQETTIASQKDKDETSFFEGIDTSIAGLAQYAAPNPPESLKTGLAAIADAAQKARQAFDGGNDAGTAAPVVAGLSAVRALRGQLAAMGLSEQARYEIDFRLENEEQDFRDAVLAAYGVSFEALADDGLVIGGQPVKVTLVAISRTGSDVSVTDVSVAGFDGRAACTPGPLKKDVAFACVADVQIPKDAKLTKPYWTDEYWNTRPQKAALDIYPPDVPFGVPFRPSPFQATFRLKAGGVDIVKDMPVQFRYVKDIFQGEKRIEVNVVPAFSVKTTPTTSVVPAPAATAAKPVERDIHVSVTNGMKGAAQASVALELPAGWKSVPASAPLNFLAEDESLTVRFAVTVPASVKPGGYTARAVVTSAATGAATFSNGYTDIEYPHIQRQQVIDPAETAFKVMNVKVTPGIRLGYIVGAGDQVPPALEQLGAKVSFIEADELAWGDLSKYDVIMTGVRAYERRRDLRAYNRRLLDFAERGGTVIVQYNKMEFNQAQYGPYPAKVGGGRVTDENAPVVVLVPAHPVFNFPNKIGESTWKDWVQERGLYFLGEKDPKYVDLIQMEDPFPDNAGIKMGSLVEAKVGKGRWLYVGLGLWRQVPAATEGAYQLFANLISLPKAPAAPATPAAAPAAKKVPVPVK
ncbi:MAG: PIG-L family deacetylase [Acidobacteria bacterium]|nr:PIG-L family deacetylase [Acidobacteriota bacterium]